MLKYLIGSVLVLIICTSTAIAEPKVTKTVNGWYGYYEYTPYDRIIKLEKQVDKMEESLNSFMDRVDEITKKIIAIDDRKITGDNFYKGQEVYEIVKGRGVVTSISILSNTNAKPP